MKDSARHPAPKHGDGILKGCLDGTPIARPSRTPRLKPTHAVAEGNLPLANRAYPSLIACCPSRSSQYRPANERDVPVRKKAN